MEISEKELEDYIFENFESIFGCSAEGLERQFKIGNYGIVDILRFEVTEGLGKPIIHIDIYELKKESIDIHAIYQIIKYRRGLERLFVKKSINITCHLIGREVHDDIQFLLSQIEGLSVHIYSLSLVDGLTIDVDIGLNWYLHNENLKKSSHYLSKENKEIYISLINEMREFNKINRGQNGIQNN